MNAVAIFKWAPDPKDIRVNNDGTVDRSGAAPWVGDDDYLAVQVARNAVGDDGKVIGLTLAGGDISFAAARGADRTVTIEGLPSAANAALTAQKLVDAIKAVDSPEVVVIGDSDWEPGVPVMLGALLGRTTVMAVDDAKPDNGKLLVTRRYGLGTQELSIKGPVVLGVAAKREEENKPGMKAVIAGRKKPVSNVECEITADYGISKMKLCGTHLPDTKPSKLFDGKNPDNAVTQLIQAMQADGAF